MVGFMVLPAAATPRVDSMLTLVENPDRNSPSFEELDLPPETIEASPVLQRWMEEIPDVWAEIPRQPSFPTRMRLGYVRWVDGEGGWSVGVEDVFVDLTGFTLSGGYDQTGDGDRSIGVDLRYYLLPLGSYVNLTPVVGYRSLERDGEFRDGLNVGFRLLVVLSRGGGSDLSISQIWVVPLSGEEVSLTTLSAGYALTHHLRISTDLQRHNGEGRIGIFMEWVP
jgi:hypothetical protein